MLRSLRLREKEVVYNMVAVAGDGVKQPSSFKCLTVLV